MEVVYSLVWLNGLGSDLLRTRLRGRDIVLVLDGLDEHVDHAVDALLLEVTSGVASPAVEPLEDGLVSRDDVLVDRRDVVVVQDAVEHPEGLPVLGASLQHRAENQHLPVQTLTEIGHADGGLELRVRVCGALLRIRHGPSMGWCGARCLALPRCDSVFQKNGFLSSLA